MMMNGSVNEPLDDAEMSCAVADDWMRCCFDQKSLPCPRPTCEGVPLYAPTPEDVLARKAFLKDSKDRAETMVKGWWYCAEPHSPGGK